MSQELDQIIDALEKRLQVLLNCRRQKEWKFRLGKLEDAEKLNYHDTSWETVTLPHTWDVKKEAWFRKKVIIPESIEGISVEGSKVELFSSIILVPTEVFVDGKKVLFAEHWADFRKPGVLVSKSASPGKEHIIVIHTLPGGSLLHIPIITELHYSKVDDIIFELASFVEELKFAQELPKGKELCEEAVANITPEIILTLEPNRLLTFINKIEKDLSPLEPFAKEHTVHLIGHAHIDMNWLWPWEETVDVCRRDFDTVTHLMDEFPEFCFSQSQTATYKIMEEKFPHIFEKIRNKINEGRWDVTASTWVEGDLNMANGEAIAHQILYGKRYAKEKLGVEPKVLWEPDTFGHPWSMPTILKKSGVDYYYFMRCGKGFPMFWWEGPDGSRVLAFNSVYNAFINPKELAQLSRDFKKKFGTKTAMFVYGVGDHGGGPTRKDIEITNRLNQKAVFPHLEFSTTKRFFETISKEKLNLPVVKDELNFVWDGCYTTHSDIKEHNRKCERFLLNAEIVGSIAKVLGGSYPDLKDSWEKTLFNQFHDILPGSAIHTSYEYSDELAKEAEKGANKAISDSLSAIAKNINVKQEGLPILVFNPLAWERDDIVSLSLPENIPAPCLLKDEEGNVYPVQILEDKLLFVAKDIPSLGYKVFYLTQDEIKDSSVVSRESLVLENEFYTLKIDDKSGTIAYLYDKKNDKVIMKRQMDEVIDSPERVEFATPVMNNLLQVLYELPHPMSAWAIGPISSIRNLIKEPEIKLITSGPVVEKIRITHTFNNSTITQDISMYEGVPRVDFITRIDWQEKADDTTDAPMLKASFTPVLNKTKATFEIPFGHIERVADGREVPALQWIDISDDEYGVSLLSNTKYGFDVKGNTMRITLMRTSYEPDPVSDAGEHTFIYSIYPHNGDWKKAETVRKGYELNHPLMSLIIKSKGKGNLPQSKSFISLAPSNVVLTCLKKAEDSDDLILRVYESKGEKAEVDIEFGFAVKEVAEVNLIEGTVKNSTNSFKNSKLFFSIDPYEIKTFSLRLRKL